MFKFPCKTEWAVYGLVCLALTMLAGALQSAFMSVLFTSFTFVVGLPLALISLFMGLRPNGVHRTNKVEKHLPSAFATVGPRGVKPVEKEPRKLELTPDQLQTLILNLNKKEQKEKTASEEFRDLYGG